MCRQGSRVRASVNQTDLTDSGYINAKRFSSQEREQDEGQAGKCANCCEGANQQGIRLEAKRARGEQ